MKFPVALLLVLGALSLAGCVTKDSTVQVARPGDPVKRNTFDDLNPRPSTEDPWLRENKQPASRQHP